MRSPTPLSATHVSFADYRLERGPWFQVVGSSTIAHGAHNRETMGHVGSVALYCR